MRKGRRVLVTGGSGRVGKHVISELTSHSYEVTNLDLVTADFAETYVVDLTEPQELDGVIGTFDAVVHLAAKPSLRTAGPYDVFRTNCLASYNVLEFAYNRRIAKVVMASSEAVVGLANSFSPALPLFLPVDETHPVLAQDAYGLSKAVQEQLAAGFARRRAEMSIVNLRFSWVLDSIDYPDVVAGLKASPSSGVRKIWSYVDIRDASVAVRLAVEWERPGAEVFFIAADDTLSQDHSNTLAATCFPEVPIRPEGLSERQSFIDCGKARRLLGYSPKYSCLDRTP